ncbi:MAG: hypothetical protein V4663_09780 [Bacteroidota bacterium]
METLKINTPIAVKLFSFTLLLILLTGFQKLSAQLYFANAEGSQIKISGTKNNVQIAPVTNYFSSEGKFTMIGGELHYLNSLNFNLPLRVENKSLTLINTALLATTEPKNDINFQLTHSMVLPELSMIHAIGYLTIQGVKTRVDFHLDYIENSAETITVMGKKAIKLSDYKKDPISIFADAKTQDIIQLDLKLVIKNPVKVDYIAALAK